MTISFLFSQEPGDTCACTGTHTYKSQFRSSCFLAQDFPVASHFLGKRDGRLHSSPKGPVPSSPPQVPPSAPSSLWPCPSLFFVASLPVLRFCSQASLWLGCSFLNKPMTFPPALRRTPPKCHLIQKPFLTTFINQLPSSAWHGFT